MVIVPKSVRIHLGFNPEHMSLGFSFSIKSCRSTERLALDLTARSMTDQQSGVILNRLMSRLRKIPYVTSAAIPADSFVVRKP